MEINSAVQSMGRVFMILGMTLGCPAAAYSQTVAQGTQTNVPRPVMRAKFTPTPVKVDGKLDEAVWRDAPAYALTVFPLAAEDMGTEKEKPLEGGEVKLVWDNENLYAAFKLDDSDVVAEGERDQVYHFKYGDLAELFLKPADRTWYWELYATPAGRKSAIFVPGRGRLFLEKSMFGYRCGMKTAARTEGTLNTWEDRDACWTVEIAMPVKDLTARGEKFGPDSAWLVYAGRYNFSVHLPEKEISSAPPMPGRKWFGAYEDWAELRFDR